MENNEIIKVEVVINQECSNVWDFWTTPEHITKWNQATEEWHCPKAVNNLKAGGTFNYRMEAKNGSMGFDFTGTYSKIMPHEKIDFALEDGRHVEIDFIKEGEKTRIIEVFDLDSENSPGIQKQGWQAILNNFKNYVESN